MLKKLKQWFILPYKAWVLLAVFMGTGLASTLSDYTLGVPLSILLYFTLGGMIVGAAIALTWMRWRLKRKTVELTVALADGNDD